MQELKHHLPILIDAALEGAMQGLWSMNEVVVAGAPGRTESDYALVREQGIRVVFGETHRILAQAKRAWVASGTATLEAALLNTPHVLVYKTSWVTYQVAKWLATVKFIGLPNILLNRALVPELIQHDLTSSNLLSHTSQSLEAQRRGFSELQSQLGGPGAARRLAQQLLEAFTKESGSET
jgi:lipid-A-disaccharide synthase